MGRGMLGCSPSREGTPPEPGYGRFEGAGGYGRGLASHLIDEGERVIEIDRPKRPARRNGEKTDVLDATRAARECLARGETTELRGRGPREALRAILRTREGAVRARTQAFNHLQALVTTAPETLRAKLRGLKSQPLAQRCAKLRMAATHTDEQRGTSIALRATARRIQSLNDEIKELDAELEPLVRALASTLLREQGNRTGQRGRDGVRLVAPGTRAFRSRIRETRRSRSDPCIVRPNSPPPPQPMRRPQAQPCDPQCRPRSLGPPPRDPTLCRTQARRREDRPRD